VGKKMTILLTCLRFQNSGESPYGELFSANNCCWICCGVGPAFSGFAALKNTKEKIYCRLLSCDKW